MNRIFLLIGLCVASQLAMANGMGNNDDALEYVTVTVEPITNTSDVSNDSTARATNTLVSDGSDFNLEFFQPTDYLSLALPGASSDYGSTAPCLESRRGWIFAGFGASGRTRTNEDCIADQTSKRKHYQCIQIVDRLVALQRMQHALAQLVACGAVVEE